MVNRRIEPSLGELKNLKTPLNQGEVFFLNYLVSELPVEWEIYIQPPLNGLRPDFVILHPENGIGVFEVKDWSSSLKLRHNKGGRLMIAPPNQDREVVHSQQPIPQISKYRSEIKDVFCPSMNDRKYFSAIYCGLVFPQWTRERLNELFNDDVRTRLGFQDRWDNNIIIGKDSLRPGQIKDFFPNAFKAHRWMTEQIANEMRAWLVESVLDEEQRLYPKLNADQNNLINTKTKSGYRRVKGPAGSGKTICLAGRAAKLQSEGKKVLVLCYNITLISEFRDLAVRFNNEAREIEIRNYHDWCGKILEENGYGGKYRDLFVEKNEMERDEAFKKGVPELLNDVFRKMRLLTDKLPPHLTYDAVIVDEGQDFTEEWWQTIRQVLKPDGEALLAADVTQDLYGTANFWTDEPMPGAGFTGDWYKLKNVYRLPGKIHEFANDFAETFLPDAKEKVLAMPDQHAIDLEPVIFQWRHIENDSGVVEAIAKAVMECPAIAVNSSQLVDLPYSDVTFLVHKEAIGRQVTNFLKAKNFNVKDTFSADDGSRSWTRDKIKKVYFTKGSGQAKGATIHSYKGLENRAIVAYLPEPGGQSELHAYYVAITRLKSSAKGSILIIISDWPEAKEFGKKWTERLQLAAGSTTLSAEQDFDPRAEENLSSKDIRDTKLSPSAQMETAIEGKFEFKENDTGVSFQKLFAPYLHGAKKIEITDPYIKALHQFKNLLDFIQVIQDCRAHDEEIFLRLTTLPTSENDRVSPEVREANFEDIKKEAANLKINFTHDFQNALHDRQILIDTGWDISLGRGLDVYQRTSAISIAANDQNLKKVKGFSISYHRDKRLTQG